MYLVFSYLNWSHLLVTRVILREMSPLVLPESCPGCSSHVFPPVPPICFSSCGFVCGILLCRLRRCSAANWCYYNCPHAHLSVPYTSLLRIVSWRFDVMKGMHSTAENQYSGSLIVLNPSSLFTKLGLLTPYWKVLRASGFCSLWQHIYQMPQGLCQASPILRGKTAFLPHFILAYLP